MAFKPRNWPYQCAVTFIWHQRTSVAWISIMGETRPYHSDGVGLWQRYYHFPCRTTGYSIVPVESVSLEGTSFLQKTLHITIPMLAPVILYNVVTLVIAAFQRFAEPFVMTEGDPSNPTLFYSLYLYQNVFQFFKMRYASAMAWILRLIALGIIFLLFKDVRRFSQD
jgi:hypothetical protein